jgi:hypothetical protein
MRKKNEQPMLPFDEPEPRTEPPPEPPPEGSPLIAALGSAPTLPWPRRSWSRRLDSSVIPSSNASPARAIPG